VKCPTALEESLYPFPLVGEGEDQETPWAHPTCLLPRQGEGERKDVLLKLPILILAPGLCQGEEGACGTSVKGG
jgi:hypothetical protein